VREKSVYGAEPPGFGTGREALASTLHPAPDPTCGMKLWIHPWPKHLSLWMLDVRAGDCQDWLQAQNRSSAFVPFVAFCGKEPVVKPFRQVAGAPRLFLCFSPIQSTHELSLGQSANLIRVDSCSFAVGICRAIREIRGPKGRATWSAACPDSTCLELVCANIVAACRTFSKQVRSPRCTDWDGPIQAGWRVS
jgi:hypothetical protein